MEGIDAGGEREREQAKQKLRLGWPGAMSFGYPWTLTLPGHGKDNTPPTDSRSPISHPATALRYPIPLIHPCLPSTSLTLVSYTLCSHLIILAQHGYGDQERVAGSLRTVEAEGGQ